jgi:hypothetical protein
MENDVTEPKPLRGLSSALMASTAEFGELELSSSSQPQIRTKRSVANMIPSQHVGTNPCISRERNQGCDPTPLNI